MRARRGTEKPIEIFVALFIILAVALVMIKLFEGQIAHRQDELALTQQEQQAQGLREKVELSCEQKCTDAGNNGCSLASLASLCVYGSRDILGNGQFVDLNNDRLDDYDTTLLAGVGVCEDRLYCFQMMSSCCTKEISARSCRSILRDYWTSTGVISSDDELQGRLAQLVPAGECSDDPLRWDKRPEWTGGAGE